MNGKQEDRNSKKEIRIEAEARREQSSIAVTDSINPRNVYKWLERALLGSFQESRSVWKTNHYVLSHTVTQDSPFSCDK